MVIVINNFTKVSNLINNKSAYSRMLQFEVGFSAQEYSSNPVFNYLGLWVYAEYYSERYEQFHADPVRKQKLNDLLKALKSTPFENGLNSYAMVSCKETGMKQSLPLLSAKAWDLLNKLPDEVVYLIKRKNQVKLTPEGLARYSLCNSPAEVLTFWTEIINTLKRVFGGKGLTEEFTRLCLDAPGVSVWSSDESKRVWWALYGSELDLSGLRQAYFQRVIDTYKNQKELNSFLNEMLYLGSGAPGEASALVDLILVWQPGLLASILVSPETRLAAASEMIAFKLKLESTLGKEDKYKLLEKSADLLLSAAQLRNLAEQYAQSDWTMLRAIKRKYAQSEEVLFWNPNREDGASKVAISSSEFFGKLERSWDEKLNSTWPACFGTLDRLLVQIETSVKPAPSSFGTLLSVPSYMAPALFDSITPAMKELNKLFSDNGIDVNAVTGQGSLAKLFINQFKETYPSEKCIKLDDLPTVLQDRLEILKPHLGQAANVKIEESKKVTVDL